MRSHDLVEIGGRKWCGLAGYYDDGVAPDNGGSKEGDKSQERVIVRTCYSNHTNWLIDTNCAPIQSRLLWGGGRGGEEGGGGGGRWVGGCMFKCL